MSLHIHTEFFLFLLVQHYKYFSYELLTVLDPFHKCMQTDYNTGFMLAPNPCRDKVKDYRAVRTAIKREAEFILSS